MKKILSMLLIITMIIALGGCSSKDSDVIKIGLITPKTGQVAQYGISVENGVNLAVDQINANGGIDGKTVKLITYDNKGDSTESIGIFNRLVNNDNIVALIGPVISSTTLTVAPLAEENKIPMVTPTATHLDVTPEYEYVFRACYTDPYQGGTIAKFAIEDLSAKSAAILYNSGDDYSKGLANAFKEMFESKNGTITDFEGYTSDDKDFKAVLTNIKASNPDVIFIPDYYQMVGLITSQIKEVGIDSTLIGGDGWDDVQKEYKEAVEGAYFANHYAASDSSEVVQSFISAYKDEYEGNTPNALAALGYDAANIIMDAIDVADSTNGEDILKVLAETDVEGVTGHIVFDEDGNALNKDVSIINIKDGELLLETKIVND